MAVIDQEITDRYAIYHADCIEAMAEMPDECIHFSIYSPPFATGSGGLYTYSSSERDLSNCDNYEQFFEHYAFVLEQIARVTMKGRCTAVHCTDIPSGNTGRDYLIDFPGDIVRAHKEAGFDMIARHTIWKEPLWVRNRTMTKNLAHKTIVDDATNGGVASADYLIVFRKRGENKVPVAHPTGLTHYAGGEPMPEDVRGYRGWAGKQTENRYSHWIWRHYASSVWDDIRMGRILPYQEAKDEEDEKHVHPLQLDVIERAVILRSNPGENILTPFMGVGSEVYGAVINNRRAVGIELKKTYYEQARKNLRAAVEQPVAEGDQIGMAL